MCFLVSFISLSIFFEPVVKTQSGIGLIIRAKQKTCVFGVV